MKQFLSCQILHETLAKVFGGLDPVETSNYTKESEHYIEHWTDGYNDDNNDGVKDVCETSYVTTTTTLK